MKFHVSSEPHISSEPHTEVTIPIYRVCEDGRYGGLSQQSVEVLLAIKAQSPHLQMS